MNTLKMKVLLFMSNNFLHRATGRAVLIWFLTCAGGCTILNGLHAFFIQSFSDLLFSLTMSLMFSSPAIVPAILVLYHLSDFKSMFEKIIVSIGSIVITSAFVIGFVSIAFDISYSDVAFVLYPFTLSAIIFFFLIARKQLTPSHSSNQ